MKSRLQTQKEAYIDLAVEQGMDAAEKGLPPEANIYETYVPELHLHEAWLTGYNFQTSLMRQRKTLDEYLQKNGLE